MLDVLDARCVTTHRSIAVDRARNIHTQTHVHMCIFTFISTSILIRCNLRVYKDNSNSNPITQFIFCFLHLYPLLSACHSHTFCALQPNSGLLPLLWCSRYLHWCIDSLFRATSPPWISSLLLCVLYHKPGSSFSSSSSIFSLVLLSLLCIFRSSHLKAQSTTPRIDLFTWTYPSF